MSSFDAVVVGGGVAGLSAAAHLSREGMRVLLCDAEPGLAAHASGRNAAIFRPLELDATTARLTARSLELLRGWLGAAPLTTTGVALVASTADAVDEAHRHAVAEGVAVERLEADALHRRAPSLASGEARYGLWLRGGGVLDIHVITEGLAREARRAGAVLQTGVALEVRVADGRVTGAVTSDGRRVDAPAVVLAAGAWNAELGGRVGAPLPLTPLRRHLVMLEGAVIDRTHPVVWRLDDEVYFRPEAGGVLASPCDELAWPPGAPPADARALELLSDKLTRLSPALAGLGVRRSWACLRTFAPDRELCVGPDPRVEGLWWLAGLGGRGMGVGPAAGELLAALVRGDAHPLAAATDPARLIARGDPA